MPEGLRTHARFPELEAKAGHYESFYLKASDPAAPRALWIRYTVHKRPGEAPKGSLWCTLFTPEGPRAVKVTTPEVSAPADGYIQIGDSVFGPGEVHGSADAEGRSRVMETRVRNRGGGALPPAARLDVHGAGTADQAAEPVPECALLGLREHRWGALELAAWPGMVGHNWGAEHAERWIWMHGALFDHPGEAWLDMGIGRIKVGPMTVPWIANGVLCLDGVRHQLGGIERVRGTKIDETPTGCEFTLPGKGIDGARARVGAARALRRLGLRRPGRLRAQHGQLLDRRDGARGGARRRARR